MKPDFKILSFRSCLCSSVDWLEYLPTTVLVRRGGDRSLVAQHCAVISSHVLSIDLLHTGSTLSNSNSISGILEIIVGFPTQLVAVLSEFFIIYFYLLWSWRLKLNVPGQHSLPELISSVHMIFDTWNDFSGYHSVWLSSHPSEGWGKRR